MKSHSTHVKGGRKNERGFDLDGLIVDQGVHRLGGATVVKVVHLLAELGPAESSQAGARGGDK